jgi:hypothetical protein
VSGQRGLGERLAGAEDANDLLFAGGVDPVNVDGPFLHNIKTVSRLIFAEEEFAFLQGLWHRELGHVFQVRRREARKELAASQGVHDGGLLEFRKCALHGQSVYRMERKVNGGWGL